MELVWVLVALSAAAALLAFVLALVVLNSATSKTAGRLLASVLVFEGLLQTGAAIGAALPEGSPWGGPVFLFLLTAVAGMIWAYLRLLARLGTPLVRPLRSRAFRSTSGIVLAALPIVTWSAYAYTVFAGLDSETFFDTSPLALPIPALLLLLAPLVSVFALVAAVSAWRRAEPGSTTRAQAAAFAVAFGTRDVILVAGLALSELAGPGEEVARTTMGLLGELSLPLMTLLYVPLLAYGILRTQLFDIDLKIKVGIRRSTVAAVGIAVVLVAAKVIEFYVGSSLGLIAGGVAAGLVLFLSPRLNKLGDKVADVAMPQVQPTPVYVQFKKLEVYRAAVESAHETGGVGARERASLDRLREKLGLAEVDCRSVEAETLSGSGASGGRSASQG